MSETGYLSLPAEKSLREFLKNPDTIKKEDGNYTSEYMAHLTCMDEKKDSYYKFRMESILLHSKLLLGREPKDLKELVDSNQICQAEALKYFVEKMRIRRSEKGGIIIWNLLDGYTQISDAVVDYYFRKKLAFYYIKRSEQKVCLIFDEPNPNNDLYCVNDTENKISIKYTVKNLHSNKEVLSGNAVVDAFTSLKIDTLKTESQNMEFYLIQWETVGELKGENHYCTNMKGLDIDRYLLDMKIAGFEEIE